MAEKLKHPDRTKSEESVVYQCNIAYATDFTVTGGNYYYSDQYAVNYIPTNIFQSHAWPYGTCDGTCGG